MVRRRSQFWILAGLVVACLGLVWIIYQHLAAAPGPSTAGDPQAAQVAAVPDLPPEAEFSMPPIESFEAILQRPIFSPTRAPLDDGAPVQQAAGGEFSFTLKGIVIGSKERVALFRPGAGGKVVRVSEGSQLAGWTVVTIDPNQVTLSRGEAEKVLEPSLDPPETRRQRSNRRRQAEQQLKTLLQEEEEEVVEEEPAEPAEQP